MNIFAPTNREEYEADANWQAAVNAAAGEAEADRFPEWEAYVEETNALVRDLSDDELYAAEACIDAGTVFDAATMAEIEKAQALRAFIEANDVEDF
jgi:hypothetical protein